MILRPVAGVSLLNDEPDDDVRPLLTRVTGQPPAGPAFKRGAPPVPIAFKSLTLESPEAFQSRPSQLGPAP